VVPFGHTAARITAQPADDECPPYVFRQRRRATLTLRWPFGGGVLLMARDLQMACSRRAGSFACV